MPTKYVTDIMQIYERIFLPILKECCSAFEIAGGIRRRMKSSDRLQIVAVPIPAQFARLRDINNQWGTCKAKFPCLDQTFRSENGFLVEIHWSRPQTFGADLAFLTGPDTFTAKLHQGLAKNGYAYDPSIGVYKKVDGERLDTPREVDLFWAARMESVSPEKRC